MFDIGDITEFFFEKSKFGKEKITRRQKSMKKIPSMQRVNHIKPIVESYFEKFMRTTQSTHSLLLSTFVVS